MRLALVHDYLTQYGGAERVLHTLHRQWPDAPVFTSMYSQEALPAEFASWSIHESPIARIPGARQSHRMWLPLYPAIFGQLGRSIDDADIVLADSSAWAHHANPGNDIPLVVYCHSPARFLYRDRHYLDASDSTRSVTRAMNTMFAPYRMLDRRAAQRAARVIANSQAVAKRIQDAWGIDAPVIHPPVDIERFAPTSPIEPDDWFLVVSRLVPHKWIDRAIRAANETGFRLKVIGDGRARRDLEALAGPGVELLGQLPDHEVVTHMQRCLALILPGVEDFGMTVVESQAAGRPVIAAHGGGALETIEPGVTGLHFDIDDEQSLARSMSEARSMSWDSDTIRASTERYARGRFLDAMRGSLEDVLTRGG